MRLRADSLETVFERGDERRAGRTRVASVYNTCGLREVDLDGLDERVERVDELGRGVDVRECRGVGLPAGLEHLAAWIDKLDAVVLHGRGG